jgi:hypothetical protein
MGAPETIAEAPGSGIPLAYAFVSIAAVSWLPQQQIQNGLSAL